MDSKDFQDLVLGTRRSIGGIIPNVVISEEHTDEVIVTEHPVDTGANVSDHAYVKPARVVATFGWSDSAQLINTVFDYRKLFDGDLPDIDLEKFRKMKTATDVYNVLLEVMKIRRPFSLTTKKRTYPSVIITKLGTVTNKDTENSLLIEVTFTEVRLVETVTVSLEHAKSIAKHGGIKDVGSKYAQKADPGINRGGLNL